MEKHVVVIGAGPSGLEAARSAALHGARVTLISDEEPGGRAAWHSLLPGKIWLQYAQGANKGKLPSDHTLPGREIQRARESWAAHNNHLLEQLGVRLIKGQARYMHAGRIDVLGPRNEKLEELCPDASIIAGGSIPLFPDGLKPDGKRVIAPRFMSALRELPSTLAVIGGGVTGTEFAYLFSSLGLRVEWFVDSYGLLPGFDREMSALLKKTLLNAGITMHEPATVSAIHRHADHVTVETTGGETITTEMAFVAVGRVPDIKRLGLGVLHDDPSGEVSLTTDPFGRTQFETIYAVGDVVNPRKTANRAMAQAYIAGAHAAGKEVEPFDEKNVISAVYTEPGLAQVGVLQGPDIKTHLTTYTYSMISHISNSSGWIKLAVNTGGLLSGVAVLGPHAAEIITPAALIMDSLKPVNYYKKFYAANPTYSELFFDALRQLPA